MIKPAAVPGPTLPDVEHKCAHVLVVEDDDLLRDYIVRHAASLGCDVSEASNGVIAIEILRKRADIDVLFVDIVLPGGMSGLALAETASQLRPDLRVLLTSGYNEEIMARDGQHDEGFEFLPKPFRRQELTQRLRKLLDDA